MIKEAEKVKLMERIDQLEFLLCKGQHSWVEERVTIAYSTYICTMCGKRREVMNRD
jgi:hypothetical protein